MDVPTPLLEVVRGTLQVLLRCPAIPSVARMDVPTPLLEVVRGTLQVLVPVRCSSVPHRMGEVLSESRRP